MKLKSLAAVVALVLSGPAMANCTSTFDLGVLGSPSLRVFGNDFTSTQSFQDCYNFTLSGPADTFGLTMALDTSWARDISLSSVSLSGGNLLGPLLDTTPSTFSFNSLLAGTYQFVIAGDVTGSQGGFLGGGSVSYFGSFFTTPATVVAAPVPEPGTYALLALGLAAVGWASRRRMQA